MPKISVIMSVYNAEKYLGEAIDSILNQTFKNFEFIIFNDLSTDDSLAIIKANVDPRVVLINNEEHLGLTKSLNRGIKIAKGEFIARMDADDISAPNRLAKQLEFLEKNRDYAVVGSSIKIINEKSKVIGQIDKPSTDEKIKEFLQQDNCLAHGSVLMRKDCLSQVGFYDENIRYAQDYDLFARLAKNFKLANLTDHLYFWRNHKKNISNDKREKQQAFVKMIRDRVIYESKNKILPDFSVLMANFNQEKYLESAIKSVLAQSFQNWELVIIDDCSTDNSLKVIEKYLIDKRIRFFKNEKNLGYIATLKKLIENSHAPIVGILDGDDALSLTAIEEILGYYRKNPGANFVYSQFMFCDLNLQPVKKGFSRRIPPGQTNLQADCVSAFRTFRKNCYFQTAGFDRKMIYAEDQDLYFKMEEITDLFFLDKVLYYYRVLPTSQSHDFRKAKIGRISHILARYYAYRRRRNSAIVNLKRRQIVRELLTALRVCVQARDSKRGFLISGYLIRELFHF